MKIPKKVPRKSFLEDGAYPIISQERDPVNGYWDEAEHAINVDRPLVAYGDHTQAVKYIDFDFVVGADGLKLFLTNDEVLPRYFYYYLRGNPVKDLGYARHYRLLKELDVHYPPLPEQERIVSILDKAFEGIDKAIAQTEQNLASTRELFESYLNNIFTQKGDDWVEKTIEEVAQLSRGHNPPKSQFSPTPQDGYLRFYQIRDGKSDNYAVYVPDTPKLHRVEKDDILMVAYRHIGRVFRGVEGAFNVALCKISNRDKSVILDDYLYYIIPTKFVRGVLLKASERSLIPSMSVKHFKGIKIPVPPLAGQEVMVSKINRIKAHTQNLEALYTQKLNDLKELKQSLLQQAFAGELTKEDAA
ncbi:restriction endonuclease subunit S [Akkermansiaceae bacterium]|nr:restriction endonuclease subunit S [Akkermansiaceae bacterium]